MKEAQIDNVVIEYTATCPHCNHISKAKNNAESLGEGIGVICRKCERGYHLRASYSVSLKLVPLGGEEEENKLQAAARKLALSLRLHHGGLLGIIEVTTRGDELLVLLDEPTEFEWAETFRGYRLNVETKPKSGENDGNNR